MVTTINTNDRKNIDVPIFAEHGTANFNFLLLQQPLVHIVSSRISSPAEICIRVL